MPYMYIEGNRTAAVRLLKIWVEDNIVYLDVEELKSPKTFTFLGTWITMVSISSGLWLTST